MSGPGSVASSPTVEPDVDRRSAGTYFPASANLPSFTVSITTLSGFVP